MARVMALDYGTKRTGLATTDPLQLIATPLDTVPTHQLLEYLDRYLETEAVECLVVGEPTHRDGTPTKLEPHIRGFLRQFQKKHPNIEIVRLDENYTSVEAEALILEAVPRQKDRQDKGLVDQMSAYVLLRAYMGFY